LTLPHAPSIRAPDGGGLSAATVLSAAYWLPYLLRWVDRRNGISENRFEHRQAGARCAPLATGPGTDRRGRFKGPGKMANTTSARKATRKIARRTAINKARRTRMRSSVRSVEEAIKKGDRSAALAAMKQAEPDLMRAAQRNVIHKNSASRKISRLTHSIAKLAK
jgi:small subunit ribosomal protein S20